MNMNRIQRCFVWLGGASPEIIALCGGYERMKYAALGAALLVPAAAGLLAAYYVVDSLTRNFILATVIGIAWAIALVVIDRAVLVTYRKGHRQTPSVMLRMAIAAIAGILIAHVIVLFVFSDQIDNRLNQERQETIARITASAQAQIRLARETEEARNSSAIMSKQEQIRVLQADKEGILSYMRKSPRERLLLQKDAEIAAAYRDLDRLQENQSYGEAKRVEARLAEDVEKERSRPFNDVLSRTAALHDIVRERAGRGDWSALCAYILVVLLLFTLDTMPIAIKIMMPLDTYERVLTRTLQDIENRLLLEADERWELIRAESEHRLNSRKLLVAQESQMIEKQSA